jgi:hypothetical protein
MIALAAGIVAGLLSWLISEATLEVFKAKEYEFVYLGMKTVGPSSESRNAALFKNAVLAYAVLGGVTGLALGLAGGIAGRSTLRGAVAGAITLVLGSLAGGLAALGLLPLFFRQLVPNPNDLFRPIMIYGGIAVAISAVSGAAFAIAARRGRRVPAAMLAACLGAVWSTIMFFILSEYFFADSSSTEPLSATPMVRLLDKMLLTNMAALCAACGTLGGLLRPRATQVPDA